MKGTLWPILRAGGRAKEKMMTMLMLLYIFGILLYIFVFVIKNKILSEIV